MGSIVFSSYLQNLDALIKRGYTSETDLKKVDVNAEHIISSVKEVGYCLKVYKES